MNKYQEALDNVYEELKRRPLVFESRLLKTSKPLLQELVDKATPFKPLNKEIEGVNFVHYGQCKCGCEVWENYEFCTDCGQALDWSEDE